ncbi:hypothetical protein HID58_058913 [Brassica napus]|uniref:pectinesterase n=1 Tax=Brassica napus TaxID=3708 RepID=A0ABQ7ZRZ3_BRANA|nr:hypothetical protein HID58_058913 [Brassica napus]
MNTQTLLKLFDITQEKYIAVFGNNFIAHDINFVIYFHAHLFYPVKNDAPGPEHCVQGAQAVALRLEGDQAAFYGCGFYSVHDTLLDSAGRHFFKGCFIHDAIDFIYSAERSIYHVKETTSGISRIITTEGKNSKSQPTGFSI